MRVPYWLYHWMLFIALLSSVFLALFAGQSDRDTIILADARQPGFGLIYIAERKGYFDDEGIAVEYRNFEFGKDALADMLKGNSDIATVFETPVVHQIYQGAPISIITTLHYSSKNTRIIANADRGIQKPEDLAGKRIATARGTNLEFFLFQFLGNAGVPENAVEIVDLPTQAIMDSVASGEVDAATVWNGSAETLQPRSRGKLIEFYSDTYTEVSMVAGTEEYVAKNKKNLTKFLKALVRAEALYKQNNEEAFAIVRTALPALAEPDMRSAWQNIKLDLRLDNILLITLQEEADFFNLRNIYGSSPPHFRKFIMTEYLRSIEPEAVTLF